MLQASFGCFFQATGILTSQSSVHSAPLRSAHPTPPPVLRNLVPIVHEARSSTGGVYMYGVVMFLMMAFERENNFSKSGKMERFGGGSNYSLRMFFPKQRFSALLSFLFLLSIPSLTHFTRTFRFRSLSYELGTRSSLLAFTTA
jgi:hypothetical protein